MENNLKNRKRELFGYRKNLIMLYGKSLEVNENNLSFEILKEVDRVSMVINSIEEIMPEDKFSGLRGSPLWT